MTEADLHVQACDSSMGQRWQGFIKGGSGWQLRNVQETPITLLHGGIEAKQTAPIHTTGSYLIRSHDVD